jgi:hypothetical protein
MSHGRIVKCLDADPVNPTLSHYQAFPVERLLLMRRGVEKSTRNRHIR